MFNYPMVANQEWNKIKVNKFSPKKLLQMFERETFYILDVRPMNFQLNPSFLKGSVLCPLVFLFDQYKEIPTDQNIIITDWAMKQSTVASKFLIAKGYKVVGVLKGGIERWVKEGFPVEKRIPTGELAPGIGAKQK